MSKSHIQQHHGHAPASTGAMAASSSAQRTTTIVSSNTPSTASSSTMSTHPSILNASNKTLTASHPGGLGGMFQDGHLNATIGNDMSRIAANVTSGQRRKKQDPKTGKGLRHFSMKVCEKVRTKGSTTYNEVADELVAEFSNDPIASRNAFSGEHEPFDQKNIRRRVYDALNVLMAMNIISKEKKEIKWVGLPTNAAQECVDLEQEREKRLERIKQKKQQLRDLILQQISFKNLVNRNKTSNLVPASNAMITLPFIIVNTDKKTVIDCSISNDKTEYLFNFDNTFEIHDDIEVLKRMGLAFGLEKTSEPDHGVAIESHQLQKARTMLPESLRGEFDNMITERGVKVVASGYVNGQSSGSTSSQSGKFSKA